MEDPAPVSPLPQDLAALRHHVADPEAALPVQQHDAQALRDAQEYAEKIVETIRDPLLVLTADLRVRVANPAFYHTFQVHPAETEGQLIYRQRSQGYHGSTNLATSRWGRQLSQLSESPRPQG